MLGVAFPDFGWLFFVFFLIGLSPVFLVGLTISWHRWQYSWYCKNTIGQLLITFFWNFSIFARWFSPRGEAMQLLTLNNTRNTLWKTGINEWPTVPFRATCRFSPGDRPFLCRRNAVSLKRQIHFFWVCLHVLLQCCSVAVQNMVFHNSKLNFILIYILI